MTGPGGCWPRLGAARPGCLSRGGEQRPQPGRAPARSQGIDFGLCCCAEGDAAIRYIALAGLSAELYYSYSGFKL